MNAWYDYALGWFADYYLLSTLLLAVVMLVGNLMRQPARRLVLAWATVGNLALLGVLLAVPGWSVVHLLGTPPPRPEPIVWAPEASSNLQNTPVVDGPVQPLPLHTSPALRPFPDLQTPQSGSPTPIALAASAEIREVNLSPYILAPFVLGSTIVLLWLALGAWQSFRMVRGSVPSPPEVESLLSALCDAGDRLPHLRLSQWVATGVALGLIRPMILLPQSYADRQDAEGLRLVLAHELAHLRRGDLWMLAAIRCLMVVLWAHPLYWWFRRRVRLDQETLADAAAAELTSRTDYAEQLVGWARQLDNVHPPTLAGAVGLWETKSQLRRRIAVLLDERLTILRHSSRKWKLAALVLCGTVALGLSLLTVEPGKVLAEEVTARDQTATAKSSKEPVGPPTNQKGVLEGRVVDQQGKPISGAEVGLVLGNSNPGDTEELVTTVLTNADGYYQLPLDETQRARGVGSLWARAIGHSPTRDNGTWSLGALDHKEGFEIELPRSEYTEFVLLDAERNPVADATLHVEHIRVPHGVGYQLPKQWVDEYRATSDSDGRVRVLNMLPDSVDTVAVENSDPGRLLYDLNYFLNEDPASDGPHYTLCVPPVASLAGLVISDAEEAPLQTPISFTSEVRPPWGTSVGVWGLAEVTPDQEGHFEVPKIAAGYVRTDWKGESGKLWRAMTGAPQKIEPDGFANFAVKVVRGVEVRGRVVKSDTGEGYPGFRLSVLHGPTPGEVPSRAAHESAKVETDNDGWYSAIVSPGYVKLRLQSAPEDYHHVEWWRPKAESLNLSARQVPMDVEQFELPTVELVPTKHIRGKLVDKNGRSLGGWVVYGFPELEGNVMNSFSGVHTRRDGSFEGNVAETVVPRLWQASMRTWTNEYDFDDVKYTPEIVSEEPLVLKVDVDGRTKEEQEAEETEASSDTATNEGSAKSEQENSPKSPVIATLTRAGGQLGEGTANFRFEQERTPNAVEGVCFTPDGQPADGVTVSLYRSRQQSGDFQLLDDLQTGADGRFQFADILPADEIATAEKDWNDEILRSESDNYMLVVSKKGSVTRYAIAAKPAIAAGVNARITLEPSATLTGVVTDPDGKPVEGAQVSASRGVTAALPPGIHSARTDAQGRYTIDDAAPFDREEYERTMAAGGDNMWLSFFAAVEPSVGESRNTEPPVLSVSHPDFALKRVAYDAIPGTTDVELDLPAVIVGRVVDVDGKPLAGRQVRAFTGLEQPLDSDAVYKQFILMAETDSQGRYHFDQSPAGVYELQMVTVASALPDSLPRGVTDFEVKSGEEHTAPDIQLERGGLVDLQLTDTETKKPIVFEPGAEASVNIETLGAGRLEGNRYFRTTLGEDGKLKIRCLTGTAKISVLQAGTPFDQKTNVAPEWQGVYEYENAPQVDVIGDETVKLEIEMKSRELENRISAMMQSAFKLANEDKPDLAAEELNEAIDLAKGQQLASILVMRSRFWEQAGQYDKAIADFERVLAMDPVPRGVGTLAQVQLATLLVECDDKSLRDYARAIELGRPAIAEVEAMTRGLPVQPEITKAYEALAKAYDATGEPEKARAMRDRLGKLEGSNGGQALKRKFVEATNLELSGDHVAAAKQFEQIIAHEAAQQSGVKSLAKNNLAYLLAASPNESVRDGKRAVELATQAIEESDLPNGQLQDTLAAAYAEIGDFEKAVATQQRAVEQASPTAKREMQERLELYKAGKPYRLESHPQKVENRQGATEKSELNDSNATYSANVVDAETGKPIKEFLVLPGTSRMEGYGWQWQDHLLTSFEDGQLVWPPRGKRPYQSQAIRVEAEGYVPYETEEILNDAPQRGQTIRLQPSKGVAGRLMDVDGKPVAGATVAIGMCGRTVRIDDGKIVLRQLSADASLRTRWGQPRSTTTAEDGAFTLPDESAPAVFIATHPEGVAILSWEWVREHRQVHLEPWGRIEGQVLWGQTPGAEESILMSARGHRDPEGLDIMLMLSCSDGVVSDKEGRFVFDKVPPGLVQVSRDSKPAGASKIRTLRPVQFVDVLPGGPTEMIFGGGRPVVGKLVGRDSWKDVYLNIATDAPSMSGLVDMVKEDWKAYSDFNSSEAGKHYSKQSVKVDADGSFRIEGVPPERYDVRIVQQRADGDAARIGYSTFRMETITPGEEGTPLDVGEIEVAAAPQ